MTLLTEFRVGETSLDCRSRTSEDPQEDTNRPVQCKKSNGRRLSQREGGDLEHPAKAARGGGRRWGGDWGKSMLFQGARKGKDNLVSLIVKGGSRRLSGGDVKIERAH